MDIYYCPWHFRETQFQTVYYIHMYTHYRNTYQEGNKSLKTGNSMVEISCPVTLVFFYINSLCMLYLYLPCCNHLIFTSSNQQNWTLIPEIYANKFKLTDQAQTLKMHI